MAELSLSLICFEAVHGSGWQEMYVFGHEFDMDTRNQQNEQWNLRHDEAPRLTRVARRLTERTERLVLIGSLPMVARRLSFGRSFGRPLCAETDRDKTARSA